MTRPIPACRVCGNLRLVKVLELGEMALTGRFPSPEEPDPPRVPLELVLCHDEDPSRCCGLVQLSHSADPRQMFGAQYGYRSSNNFTMVEHLRRKVENLMALAPLHADDVVLDVGSNDGTLLRFYGGAVRSVGVDPCASAFADQYPAASAVVAEFFDAARLRAMTDGRGFRIITSLAMFYDLEAPLEFMRAVRSLLARDGLWEFEQAYVADMLERLAYDSICHEHLSYFGIRQIQWMADRAGLKLVDVSRSRINGGSFSVIAARRESPYFARTAKIEAMMAAEEQAGLATPEPYGRFAARIFEHRERLREFFWQIRRQGRTVLGCGASTKGNVILQFCGLGPAELPAIADRSAAKVGLVTPGSRIPIISETEAHARRPDLLFVLPWYFESEIGERESAHLRRGGRLLLPLPEIHVVGGPRSADAGMSPDGSTAMPLEVLELKDAGRN